ncbi:LEAF RUST 10 DISEASE-RESISTANCE LOCUS RECEPTOR-LIKE PROTEIN KINASE-like 1.2 [Neltuma alba]|uniref:LEAF RUST 10 DISEASE-RESISTANCE LOCUS RECEPTOR-LIKE PROTEIN KINASE-like 1.2 n=1 Tax=Neltuma alba TaxID=207710 RepID=UPI0010A562CB|nr:LEAF RUST 10 DISEASE-RESISTANCE LOCUS RECEPTOR-LIKE PROTEIN KINASE-like 1.2 [Prosopis alba]
MAVMIQVQTIIDLDKNNGRKKLRLLNVSQKNIITVSDEDLDKILKSKVTVTMCIVPLVFPNMSVLTLMSTGKTHPVKLLSKYDCLMIVISVTTTWEASVFLMPTTSFTANMKVTEPTWVLFSYAELEKATNNFDHSRELGTRGFDIVCHEQFINEVKILTHLCHRNPVSLYGCSSCHCHELLLVYEYIPNGTVYCHLHGVLANRGLLPWLIRIKIAIETATALAYLHASDIIHCDVKTNNILLENNFCVKVVDFGLSRLFPNAVTHVSTASQGKPRLYIMWDKGEINLANIVGKKIQEGAFGELVHPLLRFESDSEVRRMILTVAELAFQCLQRDKDLKPSMDEVLNFLKRIERGNEKIDHVDDVDIHDAIGIPHSSYAAHSSSPYHLARL